MELLVVGGFHILRGMPCRSNWLPDLWWICLGFYVERSSGWSFVL